MEEFYEDPELVEAFLVESEELLQSMDQDLVELEGMPDNDELLNRVFRAMHTIKGTAGFLGYDPIVKLGHRAEDVLNGLRRREFTLGQRIMNALLAARDRLGQMLADLRGGGLKPEYEIEALLAELETVQKAAAPETDTHPQEVPAQTEHEPAEPAVDAGITEE